MAAVPLCMLSHFSGILLFVTQWTVAHQAPLSMEFPRQEYWSGLPFPPPGDLPHPGIQPMCFVSPALADGLFATEPPGKPREGTHVAQGNYGHAVQGHPSQTGRSEEL